MHCIKKIPFACSECSIRQVQVSCILKNNFGNWKIWDNKKQWPSGRNNLKNRGLFRKLCRQSNCNPDFLNYLVFSRENMDQQRCLCELMEPFSRNMHMPSTQEHCFHVANSYGYTNSDWFSQYIYSNLYQNPVPVQRAKVLKKKLSEEMRNLCELYNTTVGRSRDDELEQLVRELKQKYLEYEYKSQLKKAQTIEDDDDDRFKQNTKNLNKKQVKRKRKQIRNSSKSKKISKNLDSKGTKSVIEPEPEPKPKPNTKNSASVPIITTTTLIQPIGDSIMGKDNKYLSRSKHKLNKKNSASVPGITTTLVQAAGDNTTGKYSQYLRRSKLSLQEKSHGDGKPPQIPIDSGNNKSSEKLELSKAASIGTYNTSKDQMIPSQKSEISQQTALSNENNESYITEDSSVISYVSNNWRRLSLHMKHNKIYRKGRALWELHNVHKSHPTIPSHGSEHSQQTAVSNENNESYITEDPSLISYVSNNWHSPAQHKQHNNSNLSSPYTRKGSTLSIKQNEQKSRPGRNSNYYPRAQRKLIQISPVASKTNHLESDSLTEAEKIDYTLSYFSSADEAPIRHSTYVPNIPNIQRVPFKIHRSDVASLTIKRKANV